MKKKFVILEGIEEGNRFFSTHTPGEDETRLADGTLAYRILGYADTIAEAQLRLHGQVTSNEDIPADVFNGEMKRVMLANAYGKSMELVIALWEDRIDSYYAIKSYKGGISGNKTCKTLKQAIQVYNAIKE